MVQREIADRLRAPAGQPHLRLAERRSPSSPARSSWCARSTPPSSSRGPGSTRRSCACAAPGPAPTRRRGSSSAPPSPTAASPWRARSSTAGQGALGAGSRRPGRAGIARRRAGGGARAGGVRRAFREAPGRGLNPDRPAMLLHAPAKLNLCLYLGRPRADGLHELCSLFEPLALADLIEVSAAERDEVVCPGVEGENLATRALAALRERGWDREPLRIEIEKRVPVAAGPRRRQRRRRRGPPARRRRGRRPAGDRRRLGRRRALAAAAVAGAGPGGGRAGRAAAGAGAARGAAAARRRRAQHRRGLRRGRPARFRAGAGGARAAGRRACVRRPAPAPRRSPMRSCSSTTSSRPRARCDRGSATLSTSCAKPALRWRC